MNARRCNGCGQEFHHILFVLKIVNFKRNDRTVMPKYTKFGGRKETACDQCRF